MAIKTVKLKKPDLPWTEFPIDPEIYEDFLAAGLVVHFRPGNREVIAVQLWSEFHKGESRGEFEHDRFGTAGPIGENKK